MADDTLVSGAQDDTATPDADKSDDTASEENAEASADADADASEEKAGDDKDDDKADEGAADAGETDKDGPEGDDDDDASEGAPESYEAFALPEGMEMDDAALVSASEAFKDLGLSQEGGQKLVDLFTKLSTERSEALTENWVSTQEEWANKIKEHKEFGGKQMDESLAHAARAMDTVFGVRSRRPEEGAAPADVEAYNNHPNTQFREALAQTGIGNHPLFFEFMVKIGKSMSEDGISTGGGPGGETPKPDLAETMYPDAKS